ncbi:signal recognition particle subunit srp68 [Savitreella phatthalungensis]
MSSILALVQAQRDEYCRFDDYGRYHAHLTRRLHLLRRRSRGVVAVKKSKSGGKKSGVKSSTAKDAATKTTADPSLARTIAVLEAERAYATALQHKAGGVGKAQVCVNRLRKASKLAEGVAGMDDGLGEADRLEGYVYSAYVRGLLDSERGRFDDAVDAYAGALLGLPKKGVDVLLEAIETGLRFALYRAGTEERSVNLRAIAIDRVNKQDGPLAKLLREVDPTALTGGDSSGEGGAEDELVSQVAWAGRVAQLRSSELVGVVSGAVSGGKQAGVDVDRWDGVLGDWGRALEILDGLVAGEEDQGRAQTFELARAWAQWHALQDRASRDRLLADRATSPRDASLHWDAVITSLNGAAKIPGLSKSDKAQLVTDTATAKGMRLVAIARGWGHSLEAVALLDGAVRKHLVRETCEYAEVSKLLARTVALYNVANVSSGASGALVSGTWFGGDVDALAKSSRPSRDTINTLRRKSVAMRPAVFDIAWNYIDKMLSGSSTAPHTQDQKQEITAVPPAKIVEAENDKVMEDVVEEKKSSGGLFGFFGRR